MKLVVISHTAHKYCENGAVKGWAPTVREIDNLSQHFEQVWHLAFLHGGLPPATFRLYESNNVVFVPLVAAGGHTFREKLRMIWLACRNILIISRYVRMADAVQLRLPTGIGMYTLPWLSWFIPRTFILWVKYAGNWAHPHPPVTYRFQRWFLKRNFQKSTVTINGRWPDQPAHCKSFENPCLTTGETQEGRLFAERKNFDGPLNILFVGRIEKEKGVQRLLAMISSLQNKNYFGQIVLAGEGDPEIFRNDASPIHIPVTFAGGLHRDQLNRLYSTSHLLVLPSESEGFPKVVAEASAYGCLPCVSDVSSIGQYVNPDNGLVFSSLEPQVMALEMEQFIADRKLLRTKALRATDLARKFTYSHYNERILNEIINVASPK